MIKCPKCGATLPESYTNCQFCGADVAKVPRSRPAQPVKRGYQPEKWITVSYYVVSSYFVVSGLYDLVTGIIFSKYVAAFFGALELLLGIGLLTKFNLARGVVNVLCFLQIIFGVIGLAMAILAGGFIGPLAFIGIFYYLFRIATAGFMMFLLSETDKNPGF